MLLNLEQIGVPMKLVYQLSQEIKDNPKLVSSTQALTLNELKPNAGLKGSHGLYGSDEWWKNIEERKMPLLFLSGVIVRAYFAGQDSLGKNNAIDLRLNDGTTFTDGIYVNRKKDVDLFCVGHRVDIVYALDEMKKQPAKDGGVNYLNITLEAAVSLEAVE